MEKKLKNIHVDSLIRKVGNMMSSYNEAVKIGQWEKRWRPSKLAGECRHLQIWEVQKISWSKTSVANSIAKTNCSFKISRDFLLSPYFIMAMIYLKNANRPGPLTLMTASYYNWRTKIEEDKEFECFIIKLQVLMAVLKSISQRSFRNTWKFTTMFFGPSILLLAMQMIHFLLPIAYWNRLGVIRPGKALNNFNFIFFVLHNIIFFSLSLIWTNELHAC